MKKIAVVMSLYINDTIDFVKMAVQSILSQSFTDFDYYIQYDGKINAEVDQYLTAIADSRVIIRKRAENKGLAFSLNELLEEVLQHDYEFVARMDADDISLPNRFQAQIDYFNTHPEVECLGTWAIEITSKGEEYFRKQMPVSHEECRELFHKRDCMIHPTVMFRRSYFSKAGLYSLDTYFGEDTMMWAQGFKAHCVFANVPDYLFKFRLDDAFFTRRRGWKHAKAIFQLRHKVNKMLHFGLFADFWAFAYAVAKLMPTFVLNMLYKKAR